MTEPGGETTSTEAAPAIPPAVAAAVAAHQGLRTRLPRQSGAMRTPNDGYTIAMGDGAPYRVRDDESKNKANARRGTATQVRTEPDRRRGRV